MVLARKFSLWSHKIISFCIMGNVWYAWNDHSMALWQYCACTVILNFSEMFETGGKIPAVLHEIFGYHPFGWRAIPWNEIFKALYFSGS